MSQSRPRKVLVVGAGPVGALTALSLHRRGWDVEIWESREDPRGRDTAMTNLRSINLAISARGLEALRSVDPSLAEQFLVEAIPMKGRMIHHVDGRADSQLYDSAGGQCINSISRPILNQRLVEALPPAIRTRFNTKLSRVDFSVRTAWGSSTAPSSPLWEKIVPGEENEDGPGEMGRSKHSTESRLSAQSGTSTPVSMGKGKGRMQEDAEGTKFDLIIGCDGSWSRVRSEMMRVDRIDFSQRFIPDAYIELHMPADPSQPGGYAIDKNHLHIWPRHSFMLIALPNKDGSFTLTLFLPFSDVEKLDTRDKAAAFFEEYFPDATDIVGRESMLEQFEHNPRGSLVTILASPSYWLSHAILLGDGAHSMVPFYGQGLNAGLEDVRVFNSYLERRAIASTTTLPLGETDPALQAALRAYSTDRKPDLEAICELALRNFKEMRSSVLSPLYLLRRSLDSLFEALLPSQAPTLPTLGHSSVTVHSSDGSESTLQPPLSLTEAFPTKRVKGWTSLYHMVTFRPDVGYAEALRREDWQRKVVEGLAAGMGLSVLGAVGVGLWRTVRWYGESRR